MTRVVPATAAMKMEWDKDVEYPPETAWLSCVRESLTTIYFTPTMLEWYDKTTQIYLTYSTLIRKGSHFAVTGCTSSGRGYQERSRGGTMDFREKDSPKWRYSL